MDDQTTKPEIDEIERRTGIAVRAYFGTEQVSEQAWDNMRHAVRALARDDAFQKASECLHGIKHPVVCPKCRPDVYDRVRPQVERYLRRQIEVGRVVRSE